MTPLLDDVDADVRKTTIRAIEKLRIDTVPAQSDTNELSTRRLQ
jgi:hypothetical protein